MPTAGAGAAHSQARLVASVTTALAAGALILVALVAVWSEHGVGAVPASQNARVASGGDRPHRWTGRGDGGRGGAGNDAIVRAFPAPIVILGDEGLYHFARTWADAFTWAAHAARRQTADFRLPQPVDVVAGDASAAAVAARAAVAAMRAIARERRAWDDDYRDSASPAWLADFRTFRNSWNVVSAYHGDRQLAAAIAAASKSGTRPCSRLIVSFSTLPTRMRLLGALLKKLKQQTLPPDTIAIGVPPMSPRLRQAYTVPPEVADDPDVTIVHLPVDFGPVSKLIAGIYAAGPDPDACIVTVDDDVEPRANTLQVLASWAALLPHAAVGFTGWNASCINGMMPLLCPHGFDGYIYVRQARDPICSEEMQGDPQYARECLTIVDDVPRPAQVLVGYDVTLYRRGMFSTSWVDGSGAAGSAGEAAMDDFLLLPRLMARGKLQALRDDLTSDPEEAAGADGEAAAPPQPALTAEATASLLAEVDRQLQLPLLAEDAAMARLFRLSPPPAAFLVDDVYVGAYLHHRHIPRLVVPATNLTRLQPFLLPPKPRPVQVRLPPATNLTVARIGDVDSLHGLADFDAGNFIVTRFFRMLGWW